MLKQIINTVFLSFLSCIALAQELNVTVNINTDALQVTANRDKKIYENMQVAFSEFLNTRTWTKDHFESHERIEVQLMISITAQPTLNVFSANAQIVASRPVYGAAYQSILINYIDKNFDFVYRENQPMEYNDNAYTNNITSLLAYYAYIVIGLDYDSFSEKGGTRYFEKALNVVNNSQQAGNLGWRASENTVNRFWLADNLNSQQLLKFREGFYKYHRLGMDQIITTPKDCQKVIFEFFKDVKRIRQTVPVSILLDNFFDSKKSEIANIFSEGDMDFRQQVFNILTDLDPTNRQKYLKIIGKDG